jgi:hypothetical protein
MLEWGTKWPVSEAQFSSWMAFQWMQHSLLTSSTWLIALNVLVLPRWFTFYQFCFSDIMCGTLHCNFNVTNQTAQLVLPYAGQTWVYGSYLTYSDGRKSVCTAGYNIDGAPLLRDPGIVPNGASCGTGLVRNARYKCVNFGYWNGKSHTTLQG